MSQVLTAQMMLTTNPSSGLSQFLMHNADNINFRNGSSPDGRSVSPKSTDENISGSSATTTSSPASTPSLLNNNNNNNFISQIKLEPGKDGAMLGDSPESHAPAENLFENVSLLAQSSLMNPPFGSVPDSQAFMDAALYAMATQPLASAIRDPEILQQLFKQQAMIQRQFGAAATMTPLQLRQRNSSVQLGAAVASSSTNNSNGQLPKPPEAVNPSIKHDQGPNNEKKRGYPYTFQYCVLCQKNVHSSKLPCHIRQCHVGKPMFQCPACDFTSTYSKNNVKSHMVSLHGITGDPISYMDDYAEQVEEFMKKCFPNVRGRARPFPSRTANNYAQAANRQCPPAANKSRQRTVGAPIVTTTPSPKASDRAPVPISSPSSLLLPKFPVFPKNFPNTTSSDIPVEKPEDDNAKEEPMETIESPVKEPVLHEKITINNRVAENASHSVEFIDHDCALFTPYPVRFVSDAQLKGTVFETFNNSSELIDRIDLSEVAAVFERGNNGLLTPDQITKVAEIRRMLPAKNFEIMFALYKCDTSLLSLAQIGLIKSVSPSEVDTKRFKTFCETNSVTSLTDEEKFIIELSNIEQLYTRLRVMEMSHSHPEQLFNLHQEINVLRQVASTIRIDGLIANILQCSTIYANFLCGDFGAQLIHGLRVTQAIEICKHKLSTGESVGVRVTEMLPNHCLGDSVTKRLSLYREACKYKFSTLDTRVNELSNGLLQLEAERQALGIENGSLSAGIAAEEARLRFTLKTAQAQMNETLRYFAEQPITSQTGIKAEDFIEKVVELLRILVDNA